jgi:hypothetical protein
MGFVSKLIKKSYIFLTMDINFDTIEFIWDEVFCSPTQKLCSRLSNNKYLSD